MQANQIACCGCIEELAMQGQALSKNIRNMKIGKDEIEANKCIIRIINYYMV